MTNIFLRVSPPVLLTVAAIIVLEAMLVVHLWLDNGSTTAEVFLSLAGMALVAGCGLYFHVTSARRIVRLTKAAEAYARGNYKARVPDSDTDALGALSAHFNTLAWKLDERADAERRLRALLRRANRRLRIQIRERAEQADREMRELRMQHERESLRRAVRSMEQVIGVLGHELRTPLAALRLSTEFLVSQDDHSGQETKKLLRGINCETVRMAEMVNNMLEVARLGSGRATWNWSEFDVGSAVWEAISAVEPLITGERVCMGSEVEKGSISMRGDRDAVRRLVMNLLTNALKHTEEGVVKVGAELAVVGGGAGVVVRVRDTGAGIPARMLDKLGQPFALNSGVIGGDYVAGAGLGLAICQGIAAAHGGHMRFISREGEGTTVEVHLRADLAAPAEEWRSDAEVAA